MGIFDVPAGMLIEEVSKDLKTRFKQPDFVQFVKSGAHRERTPYNPDWFYVRSASILYRVYKLGSLGTETLRSYYGGRKNRGVRPERKVKASGKIIRNCLQLLEKDGLIKKVKKGRVIAAKGEKLLNAKAKEVMAKVAEMDKAKAEKKKLEAEKREAMKQKMQQQSQQAHSGHQAKPGHKGTEQKPAHAAAQKQAQGEIKPEARTEHEHGKEAKNEQRREQQHGLAGKQGEKA